MSTGRQLLRAPVDVTVCALLVAGCGLVFLIANVVRLLPTAGVGSLVVPVVVAVVELAAAAVVLAGLRLGRPVVLVVLIVATLMHLLIAMSGGLHMPEIVSAILAAAHVYALVLLNTRPVREHFGLMR